MTYEIETKEGKKTIEGLMYLQTKDIHGNKLREGDTVLIKEYYNREQEIVEELGGEYWTKDGKPGKDHAMGYEICTRDELKGHIELEYEGVVEYDEGMYSVNVCKVISHSPEQRPHDVGDLLPIHDDMSSKYCHPLFDFEIIERQQI